MPYINKDRILNESPKKRLIVGFGKLKENYTKEAALDYSEIYKSMSLSDIIDNSRMIFSESYYGLDFYKDIMTGNNEYCLFNSYISEKEKVLNFIEENRGKMSDEQISLYEELATSISSKCHDIKNTISITNYMVEKADDKLKNYVNKIPDLLYEYSKTNSEDIRENINSLTKEICESDNSNLFFVYSPYINNFTNDNICKLKEIDTTNFVETMENCIIVSKLYHDDMYKEAVNNIHNKFDRIIFESLANEPVKTDLNELITERVEYVDTYYSTPKSAVNRIFEDTFESELYKEENDEYRNDKYNKRLSVFESMLNLITYEYQTCDDVSDIIQGYNYFSESTTIEEAFNEVYSDIQNTREILDVVTESSIEKSKKAREEILEKIRKAVTDAGYKLPANKGAEGIFVNNGKHRYMSDGNNLCIANTGKENYNAIYNIISNVVKGTDFRITKDNYYTMFLSVKNKSDIYYESSNDVDDKDIDDMQKEINDDMNGDSTKKVEAPKPKNKANAIQFKAMDAEVQQRKKMAEAKQKGQEVKNAVTAVAQLPINVVNDIKDQVKKIDDSDSERRKKYMVEPGFRKKALRNLKLALTYGNAAKIKLSLVPVVALTRHWSKQKDRRVRNELISELQTEIKICDEKINDAGAAGDNKEKYALMRLRTKLENERTRVLFNSKHI